MKSASGRLDLSSASAKTNGSAEKTMDNARDTMN
jgi:hypothetical protein